MFAIRGLFQGKRGQLHPPEWRDGPSGKALYFAYAGADRLYRRLTVHFSPAPTGTNHNTAYFKIALAPKERLQIIVCFQLSESPDAEEPSLLTCPQVDRAPVEFSLRSSSEGWLRLVTDIVRDSMSLHKCVARYLRVAV